MLFLTTSLYPSKAVNGLCFANSASIFIHLLMAVESLCAAVVCSVLSLCFYENKEQIIIKVILYDHSYLTQHGGVI